METTSPVKGGVLAAEDVANAMLFLASPMALGVNGHTLVVDLGLSVGVTQELPPMSARPPEVLAEAGKRLPSGSRN